MFPVRCFFIGISPKRGHVIDRRDLLPISHGPFNARPECPVGLFRLASLAQVSRG